MSDTLTDSRQQLHWAVQAVAGVGRSLAEPRPDDSHSNLGWSRMHRALAGVELEDGKHAAIRFRDLTLLVFRDRGLIDDEYPLRGRTLDDAFAFFEQHLGKPIRRPSEQEALPKPPPATFDPNPADLALLDRLYDDADFVLNAFRATRPNASEVRCWPHHFDIATLQTFENGHTIGAGFLAGDAQYREPYWYVTPYPYPATSASLPPLSSGMWNTDGWFGAVLLGAQSREESARFLEKLSRYFEPIVNTRLPG